MPGIPQFDKIFVAPFPIVISLKLSQILFLKSLAFIGDQGVVMFARGDMCDDLSGLIFDDDGMR